MKEKHRELVGGVLNTNQSSVKKGGAAGGGPLGMSEAKGGSNAN